MVIYKTPRLECKFNIIHYKLIYIPFIKMKLIVIFNLMVFIYTLPSQFQDWKQDTISYVVPSIPSSLPSYPDSYEQQLKNASPGDIDVVLPTISFGPGQFSKREIKVDDDGQCFDWEYDDHVEL
ncbi:hypothetical protein BC833DRAFT_595157 [Globomyces pollinis-pini]|nr:hypothetical protein BC833DRAFT_595157 [Globomyces pollinis-pini]